MIIEVSQSRGSVASLALRQISSVKVSCAGLVLPCYAWKRTVIVLATTVRMIIKLNTDSFILQGPNLLAWVNFNPSTDK